MKKSVFELLRYANHVLFFGIATVFLIYAAIEQISEQRRQREIQARSDHMRNAYSVPIKPATKAVEQSDQQRGDQAAYKLDYELDLLQKIKDVYVFKVNHTQIDPSVRHQNAAQPDIDKLPANVSISYATVPFVHTVNLMFSREGQSSRMLLTYDALIRDMDFTRTSSRQPQQTLNVYTIVTEDSNGDGRLGGGDRLDLYSSEYDGSQLQLAMQDITNHKLIGDDRLLVTRMDNDQKQFYLLDLRSNSHELLDTGFDTQVIKAID